MSAVAGGIAGAMLLVIGGLHVLWVWSPWPYRTRAELARNVVGRPGGDLPPIFTPLSIGVAALLVAAAYLVAAKADLAPTGISDDLVTIGVWGVAAILGVRGVGGLVQSGLGIGDSPPHYRLLDVRMYSPLCLALTALIVVVIVDGS